MNFHKSINEIDNTQWDNLLQHSRFANFFQTRQCGEFYRSLSFLESFAFGISQNGELQAVAVGYIEKNGWGLMKHFTARAVVQGGILLQNDIKNDILQYFLENMRKELQKKVIFLEIRNLNDYSVFKTSFAQNGFSYLPHLNIQIQITDSQQIVADLSESKRRQIRLAQESGADFCEISDKKSIAQFYAVLKILYRTRIGTPLFPLEFFFNLVEMGVGKIITVQKEGRILGGIVLVTLCNRCTYEWFVCGSDRENPRSFPSVLATWAGIDFALKNCVPKFDFMGTGTPNKPYGVRNFKQKFGGTQVEFGRFLCVFNPLRYKIGKFGVLLLKFFRK